MGQALGIGGLDKILPCAEGLTGTDDPDRPTFLIFLCFGQGSLEIQGHLPNKAVELVGSVEPDIQHLAFLFLLNE